MVSQSPHHFFMVDVYHPTHITSKGTMKEFILPTATTYPRQVTWDKGLPGEEGVMPFLTSQDCTIGIFEHYGDPWSYMYPPPYDVRLLHLPQTGAYLVQVCGSCLVFHVLVCVFTWLHENCMSRNSEALPAHYCMDQVTSVFLLDPVVGLYWIFRVGNLQYCTS